MLKFLKPTNNQAYRSLIFFVIIFSAINSFSQNNGQLSIEQKRSSYNMGDVHNGKWEKGYGYTYLKKAHDNGKSSHLILNSAMDERFYPVRVLSTTSSFSLEIPKLYSDDLLGEHDLTIRFADGKVFRSRVDISRKSEDETADFLTLLFSGQKPDTNGRQRTAFKFDLGGNVSKYFDNEDEIVAQLCNVAIVESKVGSGVNSLNGVFESFFDGKDSSPQFRKLFFAMRDAHRKTCVDTNHYKYDDERAPYQYLVSGKLLQAKKTDTPKNNAVSVSDNRNSENPVINLFKYPAGDTRLTWDMNVISVLSSLDNRVTDLYMPPKFYDDRKSTSHFIINGKVTAEINKIGKIEYNTVTMIYYSGKSSKSNLVFEKEHIVIYSTNDPERKYGFNSAMRTAHAAELYKQIIEDIKKSGGEIKKWKSGDYDRIKSCAAIIGGRKYRIEHLKGLSDNFSHIEITLWP